MQAGKQVDKQAGRQPASQAGRQVSRQAGREAGSLHVFKPHLPSQGGLYPEISSGTFYWLTDPVQGPGFSPEFLGISSAVGQVSVQCMQCT